MHTFCVVTAEDVTAAVKNATSVQEAQANRQRIQADRTAEAQKLAKKPLSNARTPLTKQQQQVVAENYHISRDAAKYLAGRNPFVRTLGVNEAASLGLDALFASARTFDSTKGSFRTYAYGNICRYILGEVTRIYGVDGSKCATASLEDIQLSSRESTPDGDLAAQEWVASKLMQTEWIREKMKEFGCFEPGSYNYLAREASKLGISTTGNTAELKARVERQFKRRRAEVSHLPQPKKVETPKTTVTPEKFVVAWQTCASIQEVANKLEMVPHAVEKMARKFRSAGVRIKRMAA